MIGLSIVVLIRLLVGFNCKRGGCQSPVMEQTVVYLCYNFFFLLLYLSIVGFLFSSYRKFFSWTFHRDRWWFSLSPLYGTLFFFSFPFSVSLIFFFFLLHGFFFIFYFNRFFKKYIYTTTKRC